MIGNYGMIATGNHGDFDSLRGAPRPYGVRGRFNNGRYFMIYIRCPSGDDGALRQVVSQLNLALRELEDRLRLLEGKEK